jgi:hypothetical protein
MTNALVWTLSMRTHPTVERNHATPKQGSRASYSVRSTRRDGGARGQCQGVNRGPGRRGSGLGSGPPSGTLSSTPANCGQTSPLQSAVRIVKEEHAAHTGTGQGAPHRHTRVDRAAAQAALEIS